MQDHIVDCTSAPWWSWKARVPEGEEDLVSGSNPPEDAGDTVEEGGGVRKAVLCLIAVQCRRESSRKKAVRALHRSR